MASHSATACMFFPQKFFPNPDKLNKIWIVMTCFHWFGTANGITTGCKSMKKVWIKSAFGWRNKNRKDFSVCIRNRINTLTHKSFPIIVGSPEHRFYLHFFDRFVTNLNSFWCQINGKILLQSKSGST